jgi:hypothetical protein
MASYGTSDPTVAPRPLQQKYINESKYSFIWHFPSWRAVPVKEMPDADV